MNTATFIWFVMGAALTAWVLTGGADFGGGLWDLLARGPRRQQARAAIEAAIGPIWEVNHVWLIFVVVLCFTAFPRAYAVVSVAFHLPLLLALLGIVLRGAAFVFRAYGLEAAGARRTWGRVFGAGSVLAPLALGAVLGGMSSGAVRVVEGRVTTGFVVGWTTPFALLTGAFALALFALVAAVYLTRETDGLLRDDFVRRALVVEVVAGALAALVFWRASVDAPLLFAGLARSAWTWPVQAGTAAAALGTVVALLRGAFNVARVAVLAQVALVVVGWGLAMDGAIVLPDVHLTDAGAEPATLRAVLPGLAIGTLLLAPALVWIFRLFKSEGRRDARA